MHVIVAAGQQRITQWSEHSRLVTTKMVREDQVQRRASLGLVVIVPMRVIPAAATTYLFRRQAEQKEILLTAFLRHLDGRAVAGADRQRSVHHKFHVDRATCFVASGGDLV